MTSIQSEVIKTLFSELGSILKEYESRIDALSSSDDFCHVQERLDKTASVRRVGYLIEAFTGKLLKLAIEDNSLEDTKLFLSTLFKQEELGTQLKLPSFDDVCTRITNGEDIIGAIKDKMNKVRGDNL